mmetsp:Transcript_125918/g.403131  ORF Transcript_125918/g.403131 Transcript_125918/m.403131 type:complete len:243 (+) Transcript_125918:590-1318(+)
MPIMPTPLTNSMTQRKSCWRMRRIGTLSLSPLVGAYLTFKRMSFASLLVYSMTRMPATRTPRAVASLCANNSSGRQRFTQLTPHGLRTKPTPPEPPCTQINPEIPLQLASSRGALGQLRHSCNTASGSCPAGPLADPSTAPSEATEDLRSGGARGKQDGHVPSFCEKGCRHDSHSRVSTFVNDLRQLVLCPVLWSSIFCAACADLYPRVPPATTATSARATPRTWVITFLTSGRVWVKSAPR